MSVGKTRIGLIGAGRNTRRKHIPGFKAIEGVEIVGVANRRRGSAQAVADQFHIPRVYDSWLDLMGAPDVDAVCIGTWPYMHRTLVLAALERDKHVLTEARFAMNAREAHEMLDASRRKPHLVTQIVPYTLKVERAIKELIAQSYVGDLLSVDIVAQHGFLDRDGQFVWRHDRDLCGYNTLLVGGWYESLLRWMGPVSSVKAVTRVNQPFRRDASGNTRPVAVPDFVEVLCETPDGAIVHIRLSEAAGLAPRVQIWLFGSEGTVHYDGDADRLLCGRRGDRELSEIEIPPGKQVVWRVEREFINAIRGLERIAYTTFEDGVRYMEFTEAVARSAQTRQAVFLPL